MTNQSRNLASLLRGGAAVVAIATAFVAASPSYAIVGNDAYPPASLVDTNNITGVGQMVIDEGDGYIGLCTASLINPRTVILAAHCVNTAPASAYGAANGGIPIGFGFQSYNRTPTINWLFYNDHQSSVSDAFYNASYVTYMQKSLDLGPSLNFLQSDVAIAALDRPAVGIPTWTLLFSPLTEATHVTIEGYGRTGIGSKGDTNAIDFRRRVAENTLSFLGSIDDIDTALFGGPEGLPQNLYELDFNDPKFGTDAANRYDFNIFHDAALQKEGLTAGGDSGGPLIVDQKFDIPVIAAVLSGGSRYYGGQPFSSYGTTSFYQPLYLFWDWIVQNNPYKYVSAKSGDGDWNDPNHWVMDLDPAYVTIVDGKLVNALPTELGQGTPSGDNVNSPKFGQVCYFDLFCMDVKTGEFTGGSAAKTTYQASPEYMAISELAKDMMTGQKTTTGTGVSPLQAWRQSLAALNPRYAATGVGVTAIANGTAPWMPGDSNFVPNDTDGNPETGAPARYYDVTLSAPGTTTLSDGMVIIDRLTINGATTGLTIGANAAMGTWIDTTMFAGNFRVDGLYESLGDFALMGGILSGNGVVAAPYTTAVLGAIAPGTVGTVGRLTMAGNVIFSSHSGLLIDASAAGNDVLDVYGTASLGGTLAITPVDGFKPKWGETRQVLSADQITGAFDLVPDTIAGVLYPVASTVTVQGTDSTYQAEVVTFEAASFSSVLVDGNADQLGVGGLLDNARGEHYSQMAGLFDAIDPLSGDALGNALQSLAPNAARALPGVSQTLSDAGTGFLWQYLGAMNGSNDARVAIQTDALKLAANSQAGSMTMRTILAGMSDHLGGGSSSMLVASDAAPGGASGGAMSLPKGVGAFLMGQKIDGSVKLGGASGRADVDGYLVSVGGDLPVTAQLRLGAMVGFGEATATLRTQPAHTQTSNLQLAAYGQFSGEQGIFVNGFAGVGVQSIHTNRTVTVGGTTYDIDGKTNGSTPVFGLQAGIAFEGITSGLFKPAAGFQYGNAHIGSYTETGGLAALAIGPYSKSSYQARVGFDADWKIALGDATLRPAVHAFLVSRFDGSNKPISAAFAAAGGTPTGFETAADSKIWADIGASIMADIDDDVAVSFNYSGNPGSGSAHYNAFGGTLRIKL